VNKHAVLLWNSGGLCYSMITDGILSWYNIREYLFSLQEWWTIFLRICDEWEERGIASHLLQELEAWATTLGYSYAILETGVKQPEAIRLYEKNGYAFIDKYGPYVEMESSVCMKKVLAD
jgi:GNAT superfamily N-acetyltransferase